MSLFDTLPHPFVWSTSADRAAVLNHCRQPQWQRFLEEAQTHFKNHDPQPPQFPAFCHDGALDEIMTAAVLAYVTRERIYHEHLASWLRGLIAYFTDVKTKWEENLRRITNGLPPITDKPCQANPRQFFQGFSGNAYWVEGGLMACVLHLLDTLEADAPTLLSPQEKRRVQDALAHFADRYAFHEEAVKYSNRGIWANAGLLIAGLCHHDKTSATLLLDQARRRNHQLRSTFFDDGVFAEGSWAYHLMAVDALVCYTLIAEHAFGQPLSRGTDPSATDPYAGYPSIETLAKTYVDMIIPGPLPRENPRGHGSSRSHSPVQLRPSLLYAYARQNDPQIGWLIQRLRSASRNTYPTSLPVTSAAILDLGSYMPLINFWLDGPQGAAAPLPRGTSNHRDGGCIISRGSPDRQDRSTAWAHYGYLGTAKAHRDTLHVGLSIADQEILADPFPRMGPEGHISTLMHNTVIMDRCDPPAIVGQLLQQVSQAQADAWIMHNTGAAAPRRAFMSDPRAESQYYFDVDTVPSPGFSHRRAVVHFHERALVIIDSVQADDARLHRFDTMFYTVAPTLDPPRRGDTTEQPFRLRPFIRGEPCKNIPITLTSLGTLDASPTTLAFAGPSPFQLHAWSFGPLPHLASSAHSFPSGGPDVYGWHFQRESAAFYAAYALTWDSGGRLEISQTQDDRFEVIFADDTVHVDMDRPDITFASKTP